MYGREEDLERERDLERARRGFLETSFRTLIHRPKIGRETGNSRDLSLLRYIYESTKHNCREKRPAHGPELLRLLRTLTDWQSADPTRKVTIIRVLALFFSNPFRACERRGGFESARARFFHQASRELF